MRYIETTSWHQQRLAFALLSISIAQNQHCLALALLSVSIAQHQHALDYQIKLGYNNCIGWTFSLKLINVGDVIKVLDGNFSKMKYRKSLQFADFWGNGNLRITKPRISRSPIFGSRCPLTLYYFHFIMLIGNHLSISFEKVAIFQHF